MHSALSIKDPHKYFVHAEYDPIKSEPVTPKPTSREPKTETHSSMEPLEACAAVVHRCEELTAEDLTAETSASLPMLPTKALAAAKDLFDEMQGGAGDHANGRRHPEAGAPFV
jgi:hypothetical protein